VKVNWRKRRGVKMVCERAGSKKQDVARCPEKDEGPGDRSPRESG